ncbi:tRNA (adenosine(37)-N6)-dimethylallyltransferase MiaA [Candidatus Peregrinibacteria bacterium]|nr:tRNA (adenosine(37)-N6)-dimethylallyltransferase MiaA [Candidatus Peregrinibacteria bacterium]
MPLKSDLKKIIKSSNKPLIVVLGPSASGKTDLSLKIAKEIDGEIISTDSRQIYKGMRIAADTILSKSQKGIPHHMIEIVSPDKTLSLAEYKEEALKIIEKIYKKGKTPILVGGTGLYISAIIEGYNIPKIPPNKKLRATLQKEAKEKGNIYVHEKLKKLDQNTAEKIHPNNLRYVIRAIEVSLAKNKNKIMRAHGASAQRGEQSGFASCETKRAYQAKENPKFDLFIIGISWPREELYERIAARVDRQVERGLVDEIKKLLSKGYKKNLPSMSALGAKEIIPYIKGKKSLEECITILKMNTKRYAKRQMTWFRRYDNVKWLTPKELKKYINAKEKNT